MPIGLTLPVQTGDHGGVWTIGDERMHGTLSLEAARPPVCDVHWEDRPIPSGGMGFPRSSHVDEVVGACGPTTTSCLVTCTSKSGSPVPSSPRPGGRS